MNTLYLFMLSTFWLRHDFHVSIAQVDYMDQELQCALRLFTEDLENRIESDYGLKLKLGSENEHPQADSLIAEFIEAEFQLKLEGQNLKQHFLGKEVDFELIYLYFFYPCPEVPRELSVSNRVFFDSFDDQSNIVNVKIGGELRSAFLNSSETEQTLTF